MQLWSPFKKLPVAAIPLNDDGNRDGNIHCEAAICSQDSRLIAASQVSEYQGVRRPTVPQSYAYGSGSAGSRS